MTSIATKTFGQMACVRCHNQHDNKQGKFLRMSNANDAMCMDCHRSRAVSSHTQGSHPVNVTLPANATFNNPPLNANPANPTSDLGLQLTKNNGKLVCTTCHGVHTTDSHSSTFDGFSSSAGRGRNFYNLSSGDGYLLRTDRRGKQVSSGSQDNLNICTNCHADKSNHNYKNQNVQCVDCHGAHVEYDPKDPTNTKGVNAYLIRRNVTKFGQPNQIMFRYTGSKREYVNATNTGVCQGCHDVPAPGGVYPAQHASKDPSVCNNCHFHGNKHGSFAGACNKCHGHPPVTANVGTDDGLAAPATNATNGAVGAHDIHVNTHRMDCSVCHNGYADRAMPNSLIDIGFAIDAGKFAGFKSVANSGTYGSTATNLGTATNGQPYAFTGSVDKTGTIAPNQSCANVYCHGATLKNSAGANTGSNVTPNWTVSGTQATCGSCHAVFLQGGAGTAGHARHAGVMGMGCDNCHGDLPNVTNSGTNGWTGVNHVNGVVDWNVAPLSAQHAGSPQAAYKSNNGIYLTSGSTNTLAPSSLYGSCTNIYCHSNIQGIGGVGAPTAFTSPVWGGAALTCGGCHVNMATDAAATGSHVKHAQASGYNISCGTCHSGYTATTSNAAKHADLFVDVNFPTTGISAGAKYNNLATKIAGSGYASCTTSYCHSNSGPNASSRTYPTSAPVWGGAVLTCGSCHLNMASDAVGTGSHKAHASSANSSGPQYGCESCHTGYTSTTVNKTTHVDQKVNLGFTVPTTYSKAAPITAGTAFGTCSASKCHGQATGLPWGGALYSTTDQCAKCHSSMADVTLSGVFYSTAYPAKQVLNTDSKVGAHVSHLTSPDSISGALTCSDCHGVVALKDATHMNGATNFTWSALATKNGAIIPTITNGVCSNVYCHGASMPNGDASGTKRTPTWNVPFLPATLTPAACGTCHGFPPTSHAAYGVTTPTSFPTANCSGCHPNISSSATTYATIFVNKALHINGVVDKSADGGGCNGCHGYPPANKRFKGTHNNWSSARQENYSSAGGAHTVAGHIPPTAKPSDAWSNCTNCHNQNDHAMSPISFSPSTNIKVRIDSRERFSPNRTAKYTSNNLDGALHVAGTCSNVACHFQKTPKW
jgi:predicted CxxxxCH...CXXCH cytochrome family protein